MASTAIDTEDLEAGYSSPSDAAPVVYPPLPVYTVPNDHQQAPTTPTDLIEPPPPTIPDYTLHPPTDNGHPSGAVSAAILYPPSVTCDQGDDPDLPSYYNVSERLPAYTSRPPLPSFRGREPRTLPLFLFKIGFCFPPIWIIGACFMVARCPSKLNPYRHPWLEEQQRTEAEKEAFMAYVRVVEVMWAKRCLVALGMVTCFALAAGVTGFAILQANDRMS